MGRGVISRMKQPAWLWSTAIGTECAGGLIAASNSLHIDGLEMAYARGYCLLDRRYSYAYLVSDDESPGHPTGRHYVSMDFPGSAQGLYRNGMLRFNTGCCGVRYMAL